MNNQDVYLEMKAAEKILSMKKAAVTQRVKAIFTRYAEIYNRYHAIHLNVEDFNVFSVMDQYSGNSYLYISDYNNSLLQLELDGAYYFNTDAALEKYEQTLKLEAETKEK